MKSVFSKYTTQADDFIRDIVAVTGAKSEEKALKLVASLFHALRDRLSPEESMHIVAQLPMMLKALYVDGWKLSTHVHGGTTIESFIEELQAKYGRSAKADFGNTHKMLVAVVNVISTLRYYISDGEFRDIQAQLPREIAVLFSPADAL